MAPTATARVQKMPDKLQAAWRFLSEHAADYGLSPDLSNLEHVGTQATKAGTMFRFAQRSGRLQGRRRRDRRLGQRPEPGLPSLQQHLSRPPDKAARATEDQVGQDKALEVAWSSPGRPGLRRRGPGGSEVLFRRMDAFVLAYDVRLYVDRKTTGGDVTDRALAGAGRRRQRQGDRPARRAQRSTRASAPVTRPIVEQAADLAAVTPGFAARQGERERPRWTPPGGRAGSGQGLVFDPEPVTTLKDASLEDGSPANRFDPAYIEVSPARPHEEDPAPCSSKARG